MDNLNQTENKINNNCYVYRLHEISTGRWYIGSRTSHDAHPTDNYMGSSRIIKKLTKHNPENWIKQILFKGTPEEIRTLEMMLLTNLDAMNDPNSYNLANQNIDIGRPIKGITKSEDKKGKPGRPRKENKLSNSEYVKQYRAKQKLIESGELIPEEPIEGKPRRGRPPKENKLTKAEMDKRYYEKKKLENPKPKKVPMTKAERDKRYRDKKKLEKQQALLEQENNIETIQE